MFGLLMLAVAGASQPTLPTIFGLKLGAPIALPECSHMEIAASIRATGTFIAKAPCQVTAGLLPELGSAEGSVAYPPAGMPELLGQERIRTAVIDGRLEGLHAATYGSAIANMVMGELKKKFGEVTETRADDAGAKGDLHSTEFIWRETGYTVTYDPVGSNALYGEIWIETDKGKSAREAGMWGRDNRYMEEPKPASHWVESQEISALDNFHTYHATLMSDTTVADIINRRIHPKMGVDCTRHGLSVILDWPDYIDRQSRNRTTAEVPFKIDDGPVDRSVWFALEQALGLNDREAMEWLHQLANAKRLIVSVPDDHGGQEAIFDVTGVADIEAKVRTMTCGATPAATQPTFGVEFGNGHPWRIRTR